jgi:hypothetical protein
MAPPVLVLFGVRRFQPSGNSLEMSGYTIGKLAQRIIRLTSRVAVKIMRGRSSGMPLLSMERRQEAIAVTLLALLAHVIPAFIRTGIPIRWPLHIPEPNRKETSQPDLLS